ncbi:glycosyltransferase family 4 protein [Chryseotalea sanaruensis]|uniref:Glycosyltransferase family 4 protein n=2 Tax=Chryseotalea sanaruensis TaxID=2482724 RepID=A0A401U539_9BACT|nr:glycosyltransferase family 4 protein [Chryseotalea sanaruensis]
MAVAEENSVFLISSKIDYSKFRLFSWSVTESLSGNLKEFRIVIPRSLPIINQLNYFIISAYVSYKIGRAFNPQIVHGNIGYPGGFWSYCVSKILGVPFIISEHYSRFKYNFRSPIHKFLTLFSMKRATRVLSVSSHSAEEIEGNINRSVDIVPNMIDVKRFSLKNNLDDSLQIGFLGSLDSDTHQKGLDLLLDALKDFDLDFILHVGGSGRYLNYYKTLTKEYGIESKCQFYGFIAYESIPVFMNKLHFFVSASRFESFGIAMIEAMASGLPVIATNSGGPKDFIKDFNGLMVEVNSAFAMQLAIQKMAHNLEKYKSEEIRSYIEENYDKENFKRQITEIYQESILEK